VSDPEHGPHRLTTYLNRSFERVHLFKLFMTLPKRDKAKTILSAVAGVLRNHAGQTPLYIEIKEIGDHVLKDLRYAFSSAPFVIRELHLAFRVPYYHIRMSDIVKIAEGVEVLGVHGGVSAVNNIHSYFPVPCSTARNIQLSAQIERWSDFTHDLFSFFPYLTTLDTRWDYTMFEVDTQWEHIGASLGSKLTHLRIRLFLESRQQEDWQRFLTLFKELERSPLPRLELQPWYDRRAFNSVLDLLWPWKLSDSNLSSPRMSVDAMDSVWPNFDWGLCVTATSHSVFYRARTLIIWCGDKSSQHGTQQPIEPKWHRFDVAREIIEKTRDALASTRAPISISRAAKARIDQLRVDWR
jgi:hypothetical protein